MPIRLSIYISIYQVLYSTGYRLENGVNGQEAPGCMHPLPAHRPIELSFTNLSVKLDDKRQVLRNVSGLVKPGQVLAVMGPSGEYPIHYKK